MSWCPKCKAEYQTGIDSCNDCQENLVASLPENETEPTNTESFLLVVKDELEAGIIAAKLGEAGIPVLKKHPGTGEYLTLYMGYTPFGIELYVPTKALEAARELIAIERIVEAEVAAENNLEEIEELEAETENVSESPKKWVRIISIILFALWVIAIIYYSLNK